MRKYMPEVVSSHKLVVRSQIRHWSPQVTFHSFVSLSSVTKPDPHHLLVESKGRRNSADVVGAGFGLSQEMVFKGFFCQRADRGATFSSSIRNTCDQV